MKKNVLLSSALLIAISSYAQTAKQRPQPTSIVNAIQEMALRYEKQEGQSSASTKALSQTPSLVNAVSNSKSASNVAAVTVGKIAASMNIFGVLVSSQKALQWNDNINTVSFIHRQSLTYSAVGTNATGKSGTILAELSPNMGASWDSTCIWVNNVNLARYPQGALYNPPGNTNYNNAIVVASGPVTGGSGWIGNWYASKSVTATPKNAPGADQQFFPNTTVIGAVAKHDYSRQSFASTDDGKIRSLAGIYTAYNVNNNPIGYTGALIMNGAFTAGSFVWSSDALLPTNVVITSGGDKQLNSGSIMAWNEAGTVGYVVMLGARTGQILSNKGFQPIVYKTTNSGSSWALVNGIDFNSPAMQFVNNRIATVNTNSNLAIPYFYTGEGMDAAVDAYDNLHLGVTVLGTARQSNDSLGYIYTYSPNNTRFPFTTGFWPYVYDFNLNNATNQWTAYTIDSLQTEGAGSEVAAPGYTANPWAPDINNNKVTSDSRIQLSRTPNGGRIAFIWAESDTLLTSSKFNQFPDLKLRTIVPTFNGIIIDQVVTNITSSLPSTVSINNRVRSKAYFHLVSPKMQIGNGVFNIPVTVSNNTAVDGNISVDHFYIKAEHPIGTVGINEQKVESISSYQLIPNPANEKVNITMNLLKEGVIETTIYNTVGQMVKSTHVIGQVGNNTIEMNIENVPSGVYIVKTIANGSTQTKKLIVE
jgi:hypothetical protein